MTRAGALPAHGGRNWIEGAAMTQHWDAGSVGCSQLAMGLQKRVSSLASGERLEVLVGEDSSSTDIAAWCRMTGHTLVSAEHPVYVIERRSEED
jgi:tRNA 2-thiouridine synthesizing protein A